ncbi:MAG: ABC transporter permease subunit [Halococcoides sp.]
MFETTRFQAERRLPAAIVIGLGLGGFGAMMTLLAPGIVGDVDMAALLQQFPESMVEGFDLAAMATVEGFVAIEIYQYVWLLGLGGYLAYIAAGSIAGDIDSGRMDTLLAAPIARWHLLVETYLGLLAPIVVVNAIVFAAVAGANVLIADSMSFVDLAAVHALSIPYLLACGAIGTLASVAAPRRRIAEGVAAGGIVGAYLLESLVQGTDLEWLGAISPTRYYDPLDILTASGYDPAGAGILLGAAVVLVAASALLFGEVDLHD